MMDLAIVFALVSLVLGGLNEIVFKRYSAKIRSRGMMIAGVGLVWTLLLLVDIELRGDRFVYDGTALAYGLAAGVVVAVANILLLESLRHMEVSLGSTIYRLNTIAVVILSILFLGESMSLLKLSGISCGIAAVVLLYRHQAIHAAHAELGLGLALVIVGSLCRAIYGVLSKAALQQGVDTDVLLLTSALCWIVSGLCYARFVERRYALTRKKIAYALLSGCLVYGIVRSLLAALELGEASVVITIANLSFLVALSAALLMGMERVSRRKLAAMALAVIAIALLAKS